RDGMIHAFCAHAKTGTQSAPGTCYGLNPGAEIWAIMPASVMVAMAAAYTANPTKPDFSGINVGGAMRVADAYDNFGGSSSKGWRTVLVYGTRKGSSYAACPNCGAVGAIDISDPNPTNKNSSGFNFLWEKTSSDIS